jgi:hypothetical protein
MNELDLLLNAWAQLQRIPAEQADAILQAIVEQRPALPDSWWSEFNARIGSAMVQATRVRVPAMRTVW